MSIAHLPIPETGSTASTPTTPFLSQDAFNANNMIHMPIGEGIVKGT